MPSFPKSDSPCPLRWNAAPSAGRDFCSLCRRRVHNFDDLDETQRRALLAGCQDTICVAYTVRRPLRMAAAAGLGLAAALSAAAAEPTADRSPVAAASLLPSAPKPDCAGNDDTRRDDAVEEPIEIFVGGVRNPREAEWDEASDLPELPALGDDAFLGEAAFGPTPGEPE
ncbi:MAG TPA: hypothetical protein VM847_13260 [Tahibacter sp.]|nr:hypothetical protein [Tahibacter sp.]